MRFHHESILATPFDRQYFARISTDAVPATIWQLGPAGLLVGGDTQISKSVLTPLALKVGFGCLLVQCVLYAFFRSNGFGLLPSGSVWSNAPSYTAHQFIVFPLMLYLVSKGIVEWFLRDHSTCMTPQDRILSASYFSDIVLGIMYWDIPVTVLTPKLRNWPMMIHHVAMVVTAALSLGIWSNGTGLFGYYAPFFFGVTEVSTLPLVAMEMMKSKGMESPTWLGLSFAFLFLTVRALYFPFVSITSVLPDIQQVSSSKTIYRKPLYAMAVLNVLFTLLQLYWGSLILKELVKLV